MKKMLSFLLFTILIICFISFWGNISTAVEASPPPFGDSSWKLVFHDEFEGPGLDLTKWSYNYPWGNGNTHNHRAFCVPENVSISDGLLRIKSENKRHPEAPDGIEHDGNWYSLDYTSGIINSINSFTFTTGYIEGRFKVPGTRGFWPAFWTLNAHTGWPPEIDILEVLCHAPNELHTNYHYGPSWNEKWSHYQKITVEDLSQDFHTYAVEWTPDYMKWYLDGRQIGSTFRDAEWIAQAEDMYLLINLAVGGWAGNPDHTTKWPSYFECDWVRVWQKHDSDSENDGIFSNGGFESAYLSPWYAWNDAHIVNNNQRNGNYCLRVGNSPASAEQVIKVKPDTTYVFSGYGKAPAGQEVLIGVKDYGGPQITSPIRSADYSKNSVTFTSGANNNTATVFFYRDRGSKGYCYGDDFIIETKTNFHQPKPGDLNGDGLVNSVDYMLLARYLLNDDFLSDDGLLSADVNEDGLVNSLDYVLLRRCILENES